MTLKSEQQPIEQKVVEALDSAEQGLPVGVKYDLAMARRKAVLQAQRQTSSGSRLINKLAMPLTEIKFAFPAVLAIALLYIVNVDQPNSVPTLPANMLSMDLPTEDLALLEDLEFANWLAEQEVTL